MSKPDVGVRWLCQAHMSACRWGPWGRGPAGGRAVGGLKHAVGDPAAVKRNSRAYVMAHIEREKLSSSGAFIVVWPCKSNVNVEIDMRQVSGDGDIGHRFTPEFDQCFPEGRGGV